MFFSEEFEGFRGVRGGFGVDFNVFLAVNFSLFLR